MQTMKTRSDSIPPRTRSAATAGFLRIQRPLLLGALSAAFWMSSVARGADWFSGWEFRQEMQVPTAGAVRIVLPIEALGMCRPALEDLRWTDSAGVELAYVLFQMDPGPVESLAARGFEVSVQRQATVVDIDSGVSQPISGITLSAAAARFYKGVRIEVSDDRRRWETLAEGTPLFRLPEEGASRLFLPLASRVIPYLRLTLDDRRSNPIAITSVIVHRTEPDPIPLERVEARVVERTEGASETRLTLDFGAANLFLESLVIQTGESLFNRHVSLIVRELEQGVLRERILARGTLFRLSVEAETPAAQLEFAVKQRLPSRQAELVIQNDDSPPLALPVVSAQRRPDQLIGSLPQAGNYTLYSGNREVGIPHYDLGAIRPRARQVSRVRGTFSPIGANPGFVRLDTLSDLPPLGSVISVADWRFRKRVRSLGTGLQQLELDIEALSGALPSLEDIRLVTGDRQVPYLMEYSSLTRALVPRVTEVVVKDRPKLSRWRMELPANRVPLTLLMAASSTPLFQRDLRLWEEQVGRDGSKYERELARVHWVRTPTLGKDGLRMPLQMPPLGAVLFLETDNGDNGAIELHELKFAHPVTRLVFRPSGSEELQLYYGNPKASAARYDLSLVSATVIRSDRVSASLGSEERLKTGASLGFGVSAPAQVALFWGVLGLVVVVLLVIITRLLPKSPPVDL